MPASPVPAPRFDMTVSRSQLLATLNAELQPERFRDYGPNGLQVEGRAEIGTLVSGVTASRALIDAAIAAGADGVVVGSALIDALKKTLDDTGKGGPATVKAVADLVADIARGVRATGKVAPE